MKLTAAQIRNVKRKNSTFNGLDPKRKLVAIAKDVLAQLALKKYIANQGIFINGVHDLLYEVADPQLCLLETKTKCKVCARGAMVLSRVRLGNSMDARSIRNYGEGEIWDNTYSPIPGIPRPIVELLEHLFEGTTLSWHTDNEKRYGKARQKAVWQEVNDQPLTMQKIMENLVRNGGDYITAAGVNVTEAIWRDVLRRQQ